MRDRLLHALRVPARPSLPAARPVDVRVFRAAPAWLNYRRVTWAVKQAGALTGLILGVYWLRGVNAFLPSDISIGLGPITLGPELIHLGLLLIEASAWAGFLIQAVGSLMLMRLDWDQRWYLVSDRSLRVREGLIRLQEKTTTFDNIQNVTIRQGPLQRLFGIADVEVRSAGGGGGGEEQASKEDLHTVRFRGVADGPAIRDTILRRVQRARAERHDEPDAHGSAVDRLTAAAAELRAEARALAVARTPILPEPAGDPLA